MWKVFKDESPVDIKYSKRYWVTVKQVSTGIVSVKKMRYCKGKWIWENGHEVLEKEWVVIAWQPYVVPKPFSANED